MPSPLQPSHGWRLLTQRVLPSTLSGILLTSLALALPAAATAAPLASAGNSARPVAPGPITGRVVDANGQGLPGVTVVVEGTQLGSATNSDGIFSISGVTPGPHTLIISSVGYNTTRVAITVVDGQPTQVEQTSLTEATQGLSEVVVVGYGTQSRQTVTTAIASVSGKDIARQTVAGFDQALQGQAPGVQVTAPTGAPGSGINVRIRGNNSFSLTNSPLYVIDGVPVLPTYEQEVGVGNQRPNPLNTINPADIESIDVLKDAASAAIYGLRASNGVVVITTKRGKLGKPEISFNAYFGTQQLRKKIDLLNARQFAEYFNEAQVAGGRDITNPVQGFGANLEYLPQGIDTDWQDAIYRKAAMQNYQVSVRGGSEKTKYYLSGGYFNQDGIILNSGFNRYTFKVNLDQQLSNRFRAGTSLNLSRSQNNNSVRSELGLGNSGVVAGALAYIPTVPVRTADGRYSTNPFTLLDNPVGNLLETRNKANIYQAIGNVYAELDVLKNLTLRTQASIDFRSQLENQFVTRDYPGTSTSANRGSARTGTNQQTIWLVENTLTYNPELGERHNLTLLAGQSAQESDRFTSGASVSNFSSNAVPYLSAGTVFTAPYSYQDQWGLMSYFGRAIYNYDQRYLLTASLRADASSKFTDKNKWGYFPAVGVGWNISKEAFFPQSNAVSNLKLRASYGAVGNSEIGAYERFTVYTVGANYAGAGGIAGGIAPGRVGNPDVKWESTYQLNAGLDVGLVKDRLLLTFDAYRKRTQDLLQQVPLPTSTGVNPLQVIGNVGEIENKGLEFGLTSTNVQSADNGFNWSTNFNVSLNRNKVIDLGTLRNEQGQEVDRQTIYGYSILRKGLPLSSFYGYQVQGIFQSQDEITGAPTQPNNPKPGDIRFVDVNNDGKIDQADRTVIGNPNPKFTGGITNTLSWKGLELSFFFQGSYGNDIYNQNRTAIEGLNGPTNQTTAVLNRWTPTNTNTDIPRAVTGDPNGNNRFSSRFVEDGSYLRLKNLTLGYSLPTGILQPVHLSNVRVYVTGQNLLTWTKYSGYDPEVSADPFSSTEFGRDLGVYPQARTYTVGINASF
jgi:TonB-linked SusC/RagA family outer membrane protein